jgi:cysteine-rich repeat protein
MKTIYRHSIGSIVCFSLFLSSSASARVNSADEICPPDADPCVITTTFKIADDATLDFGIRAVQILEGGQLDIGSRTARLRCGNLTVDAGDKVALKVRGSVSGSQRIDGGSLSISTQSFCSLDSSSLCVSDAQCSVGECVAGIGDIAILSTIRADGVSAGSVSIDAAGSLTIVAPINASVSGDGGSPGAISLHANRGDVVVDGTLRVDDGNGEGGRVSLMAGNGGVRLNADILAFGGQFGGGTIGVESGGDAVIRGNIDVDAVNADGFGGEITVSAGGAILFDGDIELSARGNRLIDEAGDGGVQTFEAFGDISMGPDVRIVVAGAPPFGYAGDVDVVSLKGSVTLAGTIDLLGKGEYSAAGYLFVGANKDVVIESTAELSAVGKKSGGGYCDFFASRNILIDGLVNTNESVEVYAGAALSIGGTILVVGKPEGAAPSTSLAACDITLRTGASIQTSSSVSSAENRLEARQVMTVESGASLIADAVDRSSNDLVIRKEDRAVIDGVVEPEFDVIVDPNLGSCSSCVDDDDCSQSEMCDLNTQQCVADAGECGDGVLSPGEECDDGDSVWVMGEYCTETCEFVLCGDPGADGNSAASDALFALGAAVGTNFCDLCVCDVDGSGSVNASDASKLLSYAVGVPGVSLQCPSCE